MGLEIEGTWPRRDALLVSLATIEGQHWGRDPYPGISLFQGTVGSPGRGQRQRGQRI